MRRAHVAVSALVAVLWGVNFVVIDVGLEHFPPLLFATLRFVLVAFPAVLFVARPPVRWRWLAAVGLFMGVGQFGMLFLGMHLGMPAGLASLVLQAQAVFTLLFGAVVLGERLGRRVVVGTLLASGGIALIAVGSSAGGSSAGPSTAVPLVAILLVVAAAASWGAANVCTRLAQAPPGLGLVVWSSLVPPLPLAVLSGIFEGPHRIADALAGVDTSGLLALAYVVVVASLFCFGAWTSLIGRYPAGTVAPYALLVPVAGMGSAWVALGERPTGTDLLGAVVVLLGLLLVTRSTAPR
ncbi:MAG: EamA family transporter [Actinomycetes bacterium]